PPVAHWHRRLVVLGLVLGMLMIGLVGRQLFAETAVPVPSPGPTPLAESASTVTPFPVAAPTPAPLDLRLVLETVASPAASAAKASPAASPSPSPTPLPARCADASQHFPETQDSEAAVRTAFREYLTRQGVLLDGPSTLFVGLGEAYAVRH